MAAFRGQFICSSSKITVPASFHCLKLGALSLYFDESLPVESCADGVLLGHALDWMAPEKTNAQILSDLVAGTLSDTKRLAGRWALILLKDEPFVLADGGGTLSIVWNKDHFGSSAKLLVFCDPTIRSKSRPDYDMYRSTGWHSGLAFLATDTECEDVQALLPNHLLLLETRKVRRFYPTATTPTASLDNNTPKISQIVKGMVKAAALRSPLAIGLTVGFDSRLIAAAISAVPEAKKRTLFVTIQDEHATPEGHADLEGAKWIASTVDIPHRVEIAPGAATPEHRAACRESEGMIARRFEEWGELSTRPAFTGRMFISSWASEVGRAYLQWPGSKKADAQDVLNCSGMKDRSEMLPEATRWVVEAREIQVRHKMSITDLIYWELRVGRWNSACFNILGMGAWWMTLYTCRDLIEAMISIPVRERGFRGDKLYPAVIEVLCPALLARPFNPMGLRDRMHYLFKRDLRHSIANRLIALGLYDVARRAKRIVLR